MSNSTIGTTDGWDHFIGKAGGWVGHSAFKFFVNFSTRHHTRSSYNRIKDDDDNGKIIFNGMVNWYYDIPLYPKI